MREVLISLFGRPILDAKTATQNKIRTTIDDIKTDITRKVDNTVTTIQSIPQNVKKSIDAKVEETKTKVIIEQ